VADLDARPVGQLSRFGAKNVPLHPHGEGVTRGANRCRSAWDNADDREQRQAAERGCIDRSCAAPPEHVLTNAKRIALPRDDQKRHEFVRVVRRFERPSPRRAKGSRSETSRLRFRDGLYGDAVLYAAIFSPFRPLQVTDHDHFDFYYPRIYGLYP